MSKCKSPKNITYIRPISKTPALSKVFESFIFDSLFEDINDNIDSQQFGFRPGHSTFHYLAASFQTILKHFEKDEIHIGALFTDIVKAFDSLDHNVVAEETKVMGARPFFVCMLVSFLFKRSHCIQLPDHELSGFLDIFLRFATRDQIRLTFISFCF